MAVRDIIQAAGGSAATTAATYVEDVFSTYLYTGTGASQTITNGIDLATKGGMVWTKNRGRDGDTSLSSNNIWDTIRGAGFGLRTNTTGIQNDWGTSNFSSFNTNGFTVGPNAIANVSGDTYASWTFRKQAKFFTIATWTGDGVAGRQIAHDLGCVPGMIIVKCTSTSTYWRCYHKSLGATKNILLNDTSTALTSSRMWNDTAPTSTVFTLGDSSETNTSGETYVAYLFADSNSGGFGAAGTDSVVACGSFTSASLQTVNLGWEPQFVLVKNFGSVSDWWVFDNMRGMSQTSDQYLRANTSSAEANFSTVIRPTSTGFTWDGAWGNEIGSNYIYLAIRRGPMKTPTDATKVFAPITTTASTGTELTTGFPIDLQFIAANNGDYNNFNTYDRLRGVSSTSTETGKNLITSNTAIEEARFGTRAWNNTGFSVPSAYNLGAYSVTSLFYNFRRAPGFFDVVCYTGTGSATTVAHNLGVVPELIISKSRSTVNNWPVYGGTTGGLNKEQCTTYFNLTNATSSASRWNNTAPTASVFSISGDSNIGASGTTYVAYLFASCAGVSKVGSYTGNGSSLTINCGFASGARFVMIKRTDDVGDWYVWDTARGIVSANDPHLSLNTTAAEVTTDDTIDPDSSGFIVNQVSATNVNVSSATYIYLAIA